MKKTLLVSVFGLFAYGALGQDMLDKAMIESTKKEKEAKRYADLKKEALAEARYWDIVSYYVRDKSTKKFIRDILLGFEMTRDALFEAVLVRMRHQ